MKKVIIAISLACMMLLASVAAAFAQGGNVHVVQRGESLSSIAIHYGVSPEPIMNANGIYDPNFVYIGQKLTIPTAGYAAGYNGSYTVAPGDTVGDIAVRYGISIESLLAANNLSNSDFIYVGQVLSVPGGHAAPSGQASNSYKACANHYTVQWGDNLSAIAWRHGVTVDEVLRANNLYNDFIYEGQKLCMPGGYAPSPAPQPGGQHYIVSAGDTVAAIAHRFGVSQAAIIQANNLSNNGLIYEGQKLVIPGTNQGPKPQPRGNDKPAYQAKKDDKPEYKGDSGKPGYVDHNAADQQGCFVPQDVWVTSGQHEQVVKTVDTWCSMFDIVDDPDGMTSILIKTDQRKGVKILIKRGESVIEAYSGDSGLGEDILWYPTSPGYYQVSIDDGEHPSETVKFDLAPGKRGWVDFKLTKVSENPRPRTSTGWSGRVANNTSDDEPANGVWSVIIVRGPAQGLPVKIQAEGEFTARCYTGQKPEYGAGACEFGGLWPGKYTVTLEGSGASVEVFVDGVGTAEVIFDRS